MTCLGRRIASLPLLCLLRPSAALISVRSYTSPPGITLLHQNKGRGWARRSLTQHQHRPIQTSFASPMNSDSGSYEFEWVRTGEPGSLERLCSISLRACQLMNPLISAIYQQLLVTGSSNNVKKEKQDASAFTIADGLVQRLLIKVLYSHVDFRGIVGEEEEEGGGEEESSEDAEWWFEIEGLTIPTDLRPLVESTRADIHALAEELNNDGNTNSNYQHLTVFIDPIDGTREFSTGKGEQCSVCIGFANEHGRAVGGVVYRPLSQPTWVAGAKSEGYAVCDFGEEQSSLAVEQKRGSGLLTTNGSISPFVESLIEELHMERVKSGGAGNKMMMLLENSISRNNDDIDAGGSLLYIQDRGVSRWDTCAAEACLEAFGGELMKLTHYYLLETDDDNAEEQRVMGAQSNSESRYTYLASQTNLDFIPGSANLTKYNCRRSSTTKSELHQQQQPNENSKAVGVNQVKPYSNLCGLVALGKEWNTIEGKVLIRKAIEEAAKRNPPSFD